MSNLEFGKAQECRKNFLWYGHADKIHEGLGLCIEAFRKLPDCNLYVVGEVTQEFYDFYKQDIENAENILYYGFLDRESEEFQCVCQQCGCHVPTDEITVAGLISRIRKLSMSNWRIQFLNGGLANQVFQYLFARYYELAHQGQIMYLDDSYFANNTVHNGYELEKVFGLKPHLLSECFTNEEWEVIKAERRNGKSIPTIINEKYGKMVMVTEIDRYESFNPFEGEVMPIPANQYFPEIMDVPFNAYYHGYWINKNWFRKYEHVFKKELKFPEIAKDDINAQYMEMIKLTNSVSLHVRRGDYVKLGVAMQAETVMDLCQEFIWQYSNDWTVFVFSDDIEWCKSNAGEIGIGLFKDVVYVEGNVAGNNFRDMQLMSQCKGMIMSNSAFCYLAGLLRDNNDYVLNLWKREL